MGTDRDKIQETICEAHKKYMTLYICKRHNIHEVLNKPLTGDTHVVPHVLCQGKPSSGQRGLTLPDNVPARVSLQTGKLCGGCRHLLPSGPLIELQF